MESDSLGHACPWINRKEGTKKKKKKKKRKCLDFFRRAIYSLFKYNFLPGMLSLKQTQR